MRGWSADYGKRGNTSCRSLRYVCIQRKGQVSLKVTLRYEVDNRALQHMPNTNKPKINGMVEEMARLEENE